MLFVDGENLVCRGQQFAKENSIPLAEPRYYQADSFLWLPRDDVYSYSSAREPIGESDHVNGEAIRSYYFTSVAGDDAKRDKVRTALWKLGFDAHVFRKDKSRGSKGVDIALTREMLSHAFRDNYDAAALVSGDSDYIPLIQEVKSLGKRVDLWFLPCKGLSEELKLTADSFVDLSNRFTMSWQRLSKKR